MTPSAQPAIRMAIACGGTGGHLFPGLAVATQLVQRGCEVTLLVSPKEIDQKAIKTRADMKIVKLPAVGLQRGSRLAFVAWILPVLFRGQTAVQTASARTRPWPWAGSPARLRFWRRGLSARAHFSTSPTRFQAAPTAGFPDSWTARSSVFLRLPRRLHTSKVTVTGTPIRPQIRPRDSAVSRAALGLDPERPVVVVMGGSQGASGINDLVVAALPILAKTLPALQWLHLTGPADLARVQRVYETLDLQAKVHPFFADMELALGAATAAVSRAGASSMAELAALRLPGNSDSFSVRDRRPSDIQCARVCRHWRGALARTGHGYAAVVGGHDQRPRCRRHCAR